MRFAWGSGEVVVLLAGKFAISSETIIIYELRIINYELADNS